MKLLKKKTKNWVIKLFKTVDKLSSENFDTKSKILFLIKLIEHETELKAKHFDINYKSNFLTKKGFEKALMQKKNLFFCIVDFDSDNTNTLFIIDNQSLNLIEKPKKSTIDFYFQISKKYFDENSITELANNLIEKSHFDYGFITQLDSNFDLITERKIKKNIFSSSTNVSSEDHNWHLNKKEILNGEIKDFYQINYLNKSHITNSKFEKIIKEHGDLYKISNQIYKWHLTDKEIEKLKQ